MSRPNTFAKAAMLAAAGVMAFGAVAAAPVAASAQSYNYDPCKRESTSRSVVGGLLGAAIGAAIGSNAAARNARQDGALLGGAVGGIAGAAIGNRSAACEPGQTTSSGGSYYNTNRAYSYDGRSYDRPYRYEGRYAERPAYVEERVEVLERAPAPAGSADTCTLAESPIYLPDGRVQKRFVRVCQDSSGRYQVVD